VKREDFRKGRYYRLTMRKGEKTEYNGGEITVTHAVDAVAKMIEVGDELQWHFVVHNNVEYLKMGEIHKGENLLWSCWHPMTIEEEAVYRLTYG
jgi:hypothetical protein